MRRLREWRLEIGIMVLMLGIALVLLIVGNFMTPATCPNPPDFVCDTVRNKVGNWMVWIFVMGPILLVAGVFYVGDTVKKYREFNKLIDTDSKAKFVQNQDRIEYLAWLLSARLEKRVEEKKKEFKID